MSYQRPSYDASAGYPGANQQSYQTYQNQPNTPMAGVYVPPVQYKGPQRRQTQQHQRMPPPNPSPKQRSKKPENEKQPALGEVVTLTKATKRCKPVDEANIKKYFCETCKIECQGVNSFEDHNKSAKHKRKEQDAKDLQTKNADNGKLPINLKKKILSLNMIILKCRLCQVNCVSFNSYLGHVSGSKHGKVKTSCIKMNHDIPSPVPEIVSVDVPSNIREKLRDELIHHLGKDVNDEDFKKYILIDNPSAPEKVTEPLNEVPEVKPIGHEFIQEIIGESGNLICYACTLCECRFNDSNAKELHLKGRQHRQNYKTKIDSSFANDFIKSERSKVENENKKKEKGIKMIENVQAPGFLPYSSDLNPFENNFDPKGIFFLNDYSCLPNLFASTFCDMLLDLKHDQLKPSQPYIQFVDWAAGQIEVLVHKAMAIINRNFFKNRKHSEVSFISENEISSLQNSLVTDFEIPNAFDNIVLVKTGNLGKRFLLNNESELDLVAILPIFPTVKLLSLFADLMTDLVKQSSFEPNVSFSCESLPSQSAIKFKVTRNVEQEVGVEEKLEGTNSEVTPDISDSSAVSTATVLAQNKGSESTKVAHENASLDVTKDLNFTITFTTPYFKNAGKSQKGIYLKHF